MKIPCINCLTISICMQKSQRQKLPGKCELASNYIAETMIIPQGGTVHLTFSGRKLTELNQYLDKVLYGHI